MKKTQTPTHLKQFLNIDKDPAYKLKRSQVSYSNVYKIPMAGGYYYKPNSQTHETLKADKTTLYDVTYNINEYSRRKTLQTPNKNRYLIAFGGSHIFGEGVEDNETLPSRISFHSKEFQAYNFGSQGAAINNLLVNLKKYKNLQKGIQEKRGIITYFFYEYHFNRLFSQFNKYLNKNKTHPGKKLRTSNPIILNYDNSKKYQGHSSYKKLYPIRHWLKNLLVNSKTLSFFRIGIPLSWGIDNFKYLELLLNDLSQDCEKHFGPNNIYLVLAHYHKEKTKKRIKKYFKKTNIEVIDLSDLQFGDEHIRSVGWHNFRIPLDGHPNKIYYDIFGRLIASKLDR